MCLVAHRWCIWLVPLLFFRCSVSQDCGRPQNYEFPSAHHIINITSPNYPNAYPMGSSCRYRLVAPLDHLIELTCQYEVYPNNCGSEIFLVSRDGDLQFRDAETYCRTQSIVRRSHFRTLVFGYASRQPTGMVGRFACQASVKRENCRCGWSMPGRIVNGRETQQHEFPSMVALRDITSAQRIFCGGSIVTHRHVLTAAHCIALRPDVTKLLIIAGDHDLSTGSESAFEMQYAVRQISLHPGYRANDPNLANDIAIVVTATTMEWTRGVGPICLPFRQADETFVYANVDVTGWGTLSFAGSKSNTLQKADLLIIENNVCRMHFNATILSSQICTYDYRGRGEDSCQYDSGGPVMVRQPNGLHLVGIISYGKVCGIRYGIGVNTRITSHFNWLWSHLSRDVCVLRSIAGGGNAAEDDALEQDGANENNFENDVLLEYFEN